MPCRFTPRQFKRGNMHLLRKLSVVATLSIAATGLSGCAGIAFPGAIGFSSLYANTNGNNFINEQTKLGSKSSEGCVTSILGLITTGDAGVHETARKANISRVSHIDYRFENILGIYAKYCAIVYGE
ncbi:TRL-like family protein [Archangium lansingense]|uniref:TRL-like family protein n=1 Tax=Archangium lansingense TaxID=2995310 RepID=A0ABT4AFW4_9BACT|nr:TRL-like family protein [Archangium lansinium]MCY1080530.1 TRL-like family protein [Archangium lansinium]